MKEQGRERKNLTKDTFSGLFWMFSGTGIQYILRLLVLMVLARLLTPQDFGIVGAALVIVSFSEMFSHLGVGPAIIQRPQLEPVHLRVGFSISVILGLVLAGLVFTLAPYIAVFFRMEKLVLVLKCFSFIFVIKGFSIVAEALLQRELRFKWLAAFQVISYTIGFGVVGIVMAFLKFGVWSLVAAQLMQGFVNSTLILIFRSHPKKPSFDVKSLKELIYFGGGITIARFCNHMATQGDSLVVGRWLGESSLGIYSRAYQIMAMPATLIGQVLNSVLFSAMAKMQDDLERLTNVYKRGVALIALITAPSSVIMFILAPEIVNLLLGPQWNEVVLPFRILVFATLFRTSYKISDSLARATGAVYRRAWRQAVYAICIIGSAWVGSYWGISGVAVGVVLALFINFTLMAQLSLNLTLLTWDLFFKVHFNAVFLTFLVGVFTYIVVAISRAMLLPDLIVVFLSVILVFLVVIVMLHIFPMIVLGREGLWLLNVLLSYIPLKIADGVKRWVKLQ